MDYNSWSLEKKFSVLSFLVIFILGIFLTSISIWFNSQELKRTSAHYLKHLFNSVINTHFSPQDFKWPVSSERYREMKEFIQENITDEVIRKVTVWDKQGRIVFSEEPGLMGKKAPLQTSLQKALGGQEVLEFTGRKELGQVYFPIKNNQGQVLAAYEIQIYDPSLSDKLIYNQRLIWITILFSLGVLYVTLLKIMKHASKKINSQSGQIQSLSEQIDEKVIWQERSHMGIIKALMVALDAKDNYTAGHCLRVKQYALQLGKILGLSGKELQVLGEACIFHDIGKIGLPEHVLNKPGQLTPDEYELVKDHPIIGMDIINSVHYFSEHARIIRHHHERVDGCGYPDSLAGEDIPIEARILAIADTFDALTSDRPYRKGMTKKEAMGIMREVKGSQLDASMVDVFSEIY